MDGHWLDLLGLTFERTDAHMLHVFEHILKTLTP
jgi:hypothetical protein